MYIRTSKLDTVEPLSGWHGKFFHTENLSFMHYTVADNALPIPDHEHPTEEIWNVLEGKFEVTIDGETQVVGEGDVAVVPRNATHRLVALEPGRAIVVNYPHRLKLVMGERPA